MSLLGSKSQRADCFKMSAPVAHTYQTTDPTSNLLYQSLQLDGGHLKHSQSGLGRVGIPRLIALPFPLLRKPLLLLVLLCYRDCYIFRVIPLTKRNRSTVNTLMASIHPNSCRSGSSATIARVAQDKQPNPAMEHINTAVITDQSIIHSVQSSISFVALTPDDDQASRANSLHTSCHQPSMNTLSSKQTMRCIPQAEKKAITSHCYSPISPMWRIYSMAEKGLSARRVEEVRTNRIDKHRGGHRRRPSRRPFVFKSSPLAEGQGAGRLTQFNANISTQSRNPALLGSRKLGSEIELHRTTIYNGRNTVRISRFLDSATDLQPKPRQGSQSTNQCMSFAPINRHSSPFPSWSRQPQISRLCNARTNKILPPPVRKTNDYQTWEISLPKCSLPKMGMISN